MGSKLIYKHFWGDEGCSGTEIICFEYSRKDEFLYNIYERYKNIKWEKHTSVEVLGIYLYKEDFDDLENNIFELDEWFEQNKI